MPAQPTKEGRRRSTRTASSPLNSRTRDSYRLELSQCGLVWSCGRSGFRLFGKRARSGFGLFGERASPGRTEQWQQAAGGAVVASDAPGQYQEQRQPTDNGVDAHRARHHEVQVHEQAEEGGDTGQDSEDQTEADQDLTEGDQVGEDTSAWYRDLLHEPDVPARCRVRHVGRGDRATEEAGKCGSQMVGEDPGITAMLSKGAEIDAIAGQLVDTGDQPLPANIQTYK